MKVKAVLFDKDGTLIDFNATFAPATAAVIRDLTDGDLAHAENLANAVGFNLETETIDPDAILIAGSLAAIAAKWSSADRGRSASEHLDHVDKLYVKHSLTSLSGFPFLNATLNQLDARDLTLGIATNDSEAGALAHMGRLGITDRFTHIYGFDTGHGAKPKPGMVLAFADALNLQPAEIMMVGDSAFDCQAGRAAGAVSVGVTSGHYDATVLGPHADHVLPDISHLSELIDHLNSGAKT